MHHNETISFFLTELYLSIQGESSYVGWPCVFVRLSGCPLRCRWCDTVYSFKQGQEYGMQDLIEQIKAFDVPLIELTGGEPLAQAGTPNLISELILLGKKVLIETGGAHDVGVLPKETHIIMDVKCPGSGMSDKNLYSNFDKLKRSDEIKFVIAHREDFLWSQNIISQYSLENRCDILFSPAFGLLDPKDLAAWIIEERLPVRMQIQIHKYIWGPRTKGV
ncbi:MAG: radical SAM protein [Oligoflexales bacterium]|nr:radical SAM protein [Oligoflexales bacterium]